MPFLTEFQLRKAGDSSGSGNLTKKYEAYALYSGGRGRQHMRGTAYCPRSAERKVVSSISTRAQRPVSIDLSQADLPFPGSTVAAVCQRIGRLQLHLQKHRCAYRSSGECRPHRKAAISGRVLRAHPENCETPTQGNQPTGLIPNLASIG